MKPTLIFIITLATSFVYADEIDIPAFKGEHHKYVNLHENCSLSGSKEPGKEWDCGKVTDQLIVGDIAENKLTFWLWVIGTNNHQCYISGEAQKTLSGNYKYAENKCNLSVSISGGNIRVEDIGGNCQSTHCGSRAGIGNLEFQLQE